MTKKIKRWGISSCETCRRLNACEKAAAALLDLASPTTTSLVKAVQRAHEEEITDHVLWHADNAPTHESLEG